MTLDQDISAKGSKLARVYDDLGFHELALLEAYQSIALDSVNHTAHRFLSDSYANLPKNEIGRASELLQSQLLQPVNTAPVQPVLVDDKQSTFKSELFKDVGFGRPGYSEYSSAFDKNGINLHIDGIIGNRGTRGDQVIVSGIFGKTSYSLGQSEFRTNGITDSNAAKREAYDVFVQSAIAPSFNVQGEFRKSSTSRQETFSPFDPDATFSLTAFDKTKSFRLGGHVVMSQNNDVLLSAVKQQRDLDWEFTDFPRFRVLESESLSTEIQHLGTYGHFQSISGAGQLKTKDTTVSNGANENVSHNNAYFYGRLGGGRQRYWLQAGLSVDYIDREDTERGRFKRHHWNPKIGLIARLTPSTVLRAALFHSVKRQLVSNQTIEPTQIAGFGQYFDDLNGTISRKVGVALDHELSNDMHVGIEITRRSLEIETFGIESTEKFYWRERSGRSHFYWTPAREILNSVLPGWRAALSAEVGYDSLERNEAFTGAEGIVKLNTYFAPLSVRLFKDTGFSFRLTSTYVRQEGILQAQNRFTPDERFWTSDVVLLYRLAKRYGQISFGVKNLTDRKFVFTETDSNNPRLSSGRFVYGRLVLSF
jgi:hypothetical protein